MTVDLIKTFPGRLSVTASFCKPLDQPSVLILFGPSGSGKTTILRCLAGLERPDRGAIRFGSEVWLDTARGVDLPPQRRRLGYMPQDYALFPTYTVAGNIAYGLGDLAASERQRRVAETVALLRLEGMEQSRPHQLSGGQQQRVALARAIARRPALLLLDEPLSALDAPTRGSLRGELRRLLRRLAIPSVVVTHDWGEALALGDHMLVLSQGRVLQSGSPQEVFSRPGGADVARIVGVETVVEGRIVESAEGLATVQVAGATLRALAEAQTEADVFVCIRAEDVLLEATETGRISARNQLTGKVREVRRLGSLVRVELDCGFPLSAVVTRSAADDLQLAPGAPVVAAIKAGAVHLVPRGNG